MCGETWRVGTVGLGDVAFNWRGILDHLLGFSGRRRAPRRQLEAETQSWTRLTAAVDSILSSS